MSIWESQSFFAYVDGQQRVTPADIMSKVMAAELREQALVLGEAVFKAAQAERPGANRELEGLAEQLAGCYVDPITHEKEIDVIQAKIRDSYPGLWNNEESGDD